MSSLADQLAGQIHGLVLDAIKAGTIAGTAPDAIVLDRPKIVIMETMQPPSRFN